MKTICTWKEDKARREKREGRREKGERQGKQ
jgi:hypothetical protein